MSSRQSRHLPKQTRKTLRKKGGVFLGDLPEDFQGTREEADAARLHEALDDDDGKHYDELLDKIDPNAKDSYITFARGKASGILTMSSFKKLLNNNASRPLDPINRQPFPKAFIEAVEDSMDIYIYPTKHKEAITGFYMIPDETKIITTSLDKTVGIWNTTTMKLVKKLKGMNAPIYKGALSTDGRFFVAGTEKGMVKGWNLEDYTEAFSWNEAPECRIKNICVSPDGTRLLIGYDYPRNTVLLFKKENHDWLLEKRFPDMQNTMVVLYNDAFVCMNNYQTILYKLATEQRLEIKLPNIEGQLRLCGRNFIKNQLVLCYGATQVADVVSFDTGKRIRSIGKDSSYVNIAAMSHDATRVVVPGFYSSVDSYGKIDLWKTTDGKNREARYTLHDKPAAAEIYTYAVAVSPDNTLVACALNNDEIRVMRLNDGAIIKVIQDEDAYAITMCFTKDNAYLYINAMNTLHKHRLLPVSASA